MYVLLICSVVTGYNDGMIADFSI